LTFGVDIEIRRASFGEITAIKLLLDRHKNELGFVVQSALTSSIQRDELITAVTDNNQIVGIVHYRHRRDGQTTLYSIVVDAPFRLRKIGRELLRELKSEAHSKGQKCILLRCPTDLEANRFYEAEQFSLVAVETGKRRPLNVWMYDLRSKP
jgi:N-acetylglutamate synthase-like GNAT family acetyltransferase